MGKKYLIDEETLQDQADTIKDKLGWSPSTKMTVADFATYIEEIPVPDYTEGMYYRALSSIELLDVGSATMDVLNDLNPDATTVLEYVGINSAEECLNYFEGVGSGSIFFPGEDGWYDDRPEVVFDSDGNATIRSYLEGKLYEITLHREEIE